MFLSYEYRKREVKSPSLLGEAIKRDNSLEDQAVIKKIQITVIALTTRVDQCDHFIKSINLPLQTHL